MADGGRETWITGIGIVSCLGEGPDAHWQGLNAPPVPDGQSFAPYFVHRLAPVELDKQIPKKGDQRQMEPWQRIGTYAAGLALESAGAKGNAELLARMDMIVAAGLGERDETVDAAVLSGMGKAEHKENFVNERLMSDLRPTLFLAQLSNLLAGNISIVHGVTGSSRTFMGEEAAGTDAVRIAHARVEAGQSELALVGGAYNAERRDQLMLYEAGGYALKAPFAPVFERAPRGGMALGSLGAFVVLESKEHAIARQAKPLARLVGVRSQSSKRQSGHVKNALASIWTSLAPRLTQGQAAVISGATGAEPATSEERAFLATMPDIPICATGSHIGHGFEPQFMMNIALATVALKHEKLPAQSSGSRPLAQVVVTSIGHWRGEGLALVEAVR